MTRENATRVSVHLRRFDSRQNCLADVVLDPSGTRLNGFGVSKGTDGKATVRMPAVMMGVWSCPEIGFEEVARHISQAYASALLAPPVSISLHNVSSEGCVADIVLAESGATIEGIRVKPNPRGGNMVDMPYWMHNQWPYDEVPWKDVCQRISAEYNAARPSLEHVEASTGSERGDTRTDLARICRFGPPCSERRAVAEVFLPEHGTLHEVVVTQKGEDGSTVRVRLPAWARNELDRDTLEDAKAAILAEYRRQVLGEKAPAQHGDARVTFESLQEGTCSTVDVKLPHKRNWVVGFQAHQDKHSDTIIISKPVWMDRWKDSLVDWFQLCELIKGEFREYLDRGEPQAAVRPGAGTPRPAPAVCAPKPDEPRSAHASASPKPGGPENTQASVRPKLFDREKNEFGRIMDAENSPFVFFPRTTLRSVDGWENGAEGPKKSLSDLVVAMNRGPRGGIGPFEVNLLEWVARLRFAVGTTLLDLVQARRLAMGWREAMTQKALNTVIDRMQAYDLLAISRFVTVSEDSMQEFVQSATKLRIITPGINAYTLLRELNRNVGAMHRFDQFQDGNTAKRHLTSNQWLAYWLRVAGDSLDDFETTHTLTLRGPDYLTAKIYASVTLNRTVMVAEPVRRVEDFEIERNKAQFLDKIQRLSSMFDNADYLYNGYQRVTLPDRPVLVVICEDDEHMEYVREVLLPIMLEGRQEIWLTTDLRVFNSNMRGERFLRPLDGKLQPIEMMRLFGLEEQ